MLFLSQLSTIKILSNKTNKFVFKTSTQLTLSKSITRLVVPKNQWLHQLAVNKSNPDKGDYPLAGMIYSKNYVRVYKG